MKNARQLNAFAETRSDILNKVHENSLEDLMALNALFPEGIVIDDTKADLLIKTKKGEGLLLGMKDGSLQIADECLEHKSVLISDVLFLQAQFIIVKLLKQIP